MYLAGLSALLYVLSFPLTSHDVAPWPLIFISLAPLFICLEKSGPPARVFLAGALWGALMSLGMAYWLVYAMIWQYGTSVVTAVIFMIFGLMLPHGIIFGVFGLMYRFFRDNIFGPRRMLLFYAITAPFLWIVTEFTRELIPLLVPWGFAGYALQPCNLFMQMADFTGLYGISFTVVMINAVIAYLCRGLDFRAIRLFFSGAGLFDRAGRWIAQSRIPLVVLAAAVSIPLLYGAVRRNEVRQMLESEIASGKGVAATIVQANFTQDERWMEDGFMDRVNVCMGLTGKCGALRPAQGGEPGEGRDDAPGHAGFVVWPETVLNSQGMVNSRLFSFIQSRLDGSRILVAGGVRRGIDTDGVYNSAFMVSRGEGITFYDKNILLPYSETAPFGSILGNFYTAPAEFLRGDTPPAARTDAGIIGLSICFEAVYPWFVRRSVRDGAKALINISNDGWFGKTSEPAVHLRHASVRAIESRRFMVRASNNGYSAVISPTGEITRRSGLFTRECIDEKIVMLDSMTFYSLLGDWIIYAAAAALAAMLAFFIVKK
jgi:apolipoprotein N-acyltransferase